MPGPQNLTDRIDTGPAYACHRLIIAHGAGTGITSPFLDTMAALLADRDIAVTRFAFGYMAERGRSGKKRPPPKAERLMVEYDDFLAAVTAELPSQTRVIIGGKSMGGRIASMIADRHFAAGQIAGLVCLGYPFHAPKTPEKLRIDHLMAIACPTLIVQGDRDPFGTRAEVEAMPLAPAISVSWMADGDHDFGPRGASGVTRTANMAAAADAIAAFVTTCGQPQ